MTVRLYGWGPMFGEHDPSPFVLKAEIQLKMLGVAFERHPAMLDEVPRHKAPYVRDGDELIEDSNEIRRHFERKLGRDLDAGLDNYQRGVARAVERMLEDRLYFIMLMERWLEGDTFERGPLAFFAQVPQDRLAAVTAAARAELRTGLLKHGIARFSRDERIELAAEDIKAVSALLGEQQFLFGAGPTAADAVLYGQLVSARARFFNSRLPEVIDAHEALPPYLARMERRYFSQHG